MLDQWAYLNGVEIDFPRPGKPTDYAFIEALKPPNGGQSGADEGTMTYD